MGIFLNWRFFRHSWVIWKETLVSKWREGGAWSVVTSLLTYIAIGYLVGDEEMDLQARIILAGLFGVFGTQIIRFLWIALNAPFSIIKNLDKQANLYNFDNIIVKLDKISSPNYWRCYIEVKNDKPYEISLITFGFLYIEIDGELIYRRPIHNFDILNGHRLARIDVSQLDPHLQRLEVKNRNSFIKFALLDQVAGSRYRIQYGTLADEKRTDFIMRDSFFSRNIRLELHLVAKIGQYELSGNCEYFFLADVSNGIIKVKVGPGKLDYYLNE